jgi:hypothetical protein
MVQFLYAFKALCLHPLPSPLQVQAGEAAGPASSLPLHLRGLDLASLVPGLKPAMQGLSSITVLTSSMWEGAAVFIVALGGLNAAVAVAAWV